MDRSQVVNKISEFLKGFAPEGKSWLYGSEARGDSRPDSDFDVLVLLPDDDGTGSFSRLKSSIHNRLYDLEMELDFKFDISPLIVPESVWHRRKTPFTVNVTNDRIPL